MKMRIAGTSIMSMHHSHCADSGQRHRQGAHGKAWQQLFQPIAPGKVFEDRAQALQAQARALALALAAQQICGHARRIEGIAAAQRHL